MKVGHVVHYGKSNLDGTFAGKVTLYIAAADRIEVLKREPDSNDAVYIRGTWDPARATVAQLDMAHIRKGDRRVAVLAARITDQHRFGARELAPALLLTLNKDRESGRKPPPFALPDPQVTRLSSQPAHIYGFELLSLNVAMLHLREPEQRFTFNLLGDNPSLGPGSPTFIIERGAVEVRYLGSEVLEGRPCRRYVLTGPGLGGTQASLWTDRADGLMRRFESPLPNNRDWQSLRLVWQGSEQMSAARWQQWVRAESARHIQEVEARWAREDAEKAGRAP